MKKFFAIIAVAMFAISASAEVVWTETLDKNGTYIDRSGSEPWGEKWPYVDQWYNAGNFVHQYDTVASYNSSVRSKKLNDDEKNTIGFYFANGKAAASCYLRLVDTTICEVEEAVLKFEICATEADGSDQITKMILKVNDEVMTVAGEMGAKFQTTTIAVPVTGEIKSLHIAFDNISSQAFISNLRIETEDEPAAVENVAATVKAHKIVENGQLVIIKNGVRYNAVGAAL